MNNNTRNFYKIYLRAFTSVTLSHYVAKCSPWQQTQHNFCCPDKNADIALFSLRLLGFYGFSLTNKEQRSLAKSTFLKYFNMFSKSQALPSNSREITKRKLCGIYLINK